MEKRDWKRKKEATPGENDGQEAGNTDGQQEFWRHRRPEAGYPTASTRREKTAQYNNLLRRTKKHALADATLTFEKLSPPPPNGSRLPLGSPLPGSLGAASQPRGDEGAWTGEGGGKSSVAT